MIYHRVSEVARSRSPVFVDATLEIIHVTERRDTDVESGFGFRRLQIHDKTLNTENPETSLQLTCHGVGNDERPAFNKIIYKKQARFNQQEDLAITVGVGVPALRYTPLMEVTSPSSLRPCFTRLNCSSRYLLILSRLLTRFSNALLSYNLDP